MLSYAFYSSLRVIAHDVSENYLVNYLVWPHQQDAHRRGLGLSGSIYEEAHPIVSNFS